MNRDNLAGFPARHVTADASARFIYLAEAIGRAFEPTQTQLDELERAYNATGDYLSECQEFDGLLTHVHAQGSRPLGTIVRPMDPEREGFDIDLVARLARAALTRYGGDTGAALLLQHLFTALNRYAQRHDLGIERWDRCVTLVYAGGMRADFAPVIDDPAFAFPHGQHHGRIPDRDLRRYLSTNPKGYCLGFDEIARIAPQFRMVEALNFAMDSVRKADVEPLPDAAQVFGRLLSRYVQLGKVHRNNSFAGLAKGKELAPTSVFLTTLFAKAYSVLAPQPHDGPLDLLFDIVELVPNLFERETLMGGDERWVLMNPCAQSDNLAESMNTRERQQAFVQWHRMLLADLAALQAAIDGNKGLDVVVKAVEAAFGNRAGQAVLQRGAQRRESNRMLGRASFIAAGSVTAVAPARAHTYFGGPVT